MVTFMAIFLISLVLFVVPIRWIIMVIGLNKLTKKKLRPWSQDNVEVYDLISRAASDLELMNYRDIPVDKRVLHDVYVRQQRIQETLKSVVENDTGLIPGEDIPMDGINAMVLQTPPVSPNKVKDL